MTKSSRASYLKSKTLSFFLGIQFYNCISEDDDDGVLQTVASYDFHGDKQPLAKMSAL